MTSIARTSLLDHVGNTPLLQLRGLAPEPVEIYAKAEWHNPSGSVKDRPAAAIIQAALESGELGDGRRLLDSTSGNMGIAYATLAAPLRIPVHLALPANASALRKALLRALGAEFTLTDPLDGSDGARRAAQKLAVEDPKRYFYADQYANPANWMAHYRTTGPEIAAATGERLTHLVAGLGTTGTLVGTGRFLKERLPETSIVGFQPEGPMHGLEGLKHLASSDIPQIYDPELPDQMLRVTTEEAYAMMRRLARQQGLLVGPSSAAAAVAAVQLAAGLTQGVIVVIFPDSGLKYMDDPVWGAE